MVLDDRKDLCLLLNYNFRLPASHLRESNPIKTIQAHAPCKMHKDLLNHQIKFELPMLHKHPILGIQITVPTQLYVAP